MRATRGRIYWVDLDQGYGRKPFLCVSNNARNIRLDDFLAIRITSTPKPHLATVVPLSAQDSLSGSNILCDDIVPIGHDEIISDAGAVTPRTMMSVATGLRSALAL